MKCTKAILSIIVPVYNSQQYLRVCIESVLSQTYRDFELLLVDDNSSDLSGEICDEYAKMDERVRVLHHDKNKGLSATRHDGLKMAEGEWIAYIDNDDYICQEMFEKLMSISEGVDMVCGRGEDKSGDDIDKYRLTQWKIPNYDYVDHTGVEFSEIVAGGSGEYGVACPLWAKIIRKTALVNGLEIMEPYKDLLYWVYMEDVVFTPVLFYNMDRIRFCNHLMYLHRVGGLSYAKAPSEYHYQAAYSKEVLLEYFENRWPIKVYEHDLIGSFLLYMSTWYKIWKYETNEKKKNQFKEYMDRMQIKYGAKVYRVGCRTINDRVRKANVLFFLKNRELWCKVVGNFYFR